MTFCEPKFCLLQFDYHKVEKDLGLKDSNKGRCSNGENPVQA